VNGTKGYNKKYNLARHRTNNDNTPHTGRDILLNHVPIHTLRDEKWGLCIGGELFIKHVGSCGE
jgi:hypothetical protein